MCGPVMIKSPHIPDFAPGGGGGGGGGGSSRNNDSHFGQVYSMCEVIYISP